MSKKTNTKTTVVYEVIIKFRVPTDDGYEITEDSIGFIDKEIAMQYYDALIPGVDADRIIVKECLAVGSEVIESKIIAEKGRGIVIPLKKENNKKD